MTEFGAVHGGSSEDTNYTNFHENPIEETDSTLQRFNDLTCMKAFGVHSCELVKLVSCSLYW
jgi:hypothetical protein